MGSTGWHVFASHLSVVAIVLFCITAMGRFTVYHTGFDVDANDADTKAQHYDVSYILTPFLYADVDIAYSSVSIALLGTEGDTGNKRQTTEVQTGDLLTRDLDLMLSCEEFADLAVSIQCMRKTSDSIDTAVPQMDDASVGAAYTDCRAARDEKNYERDCNSVRGLWVVGAVLLFVSFLVLMWPVWTGAESPTRALAVAGGIMLCSGLIFAAYTAVYLELLDAVNAVTHVKGVTDIDTARRLLGTMSAFTLFAGIVTVVTSMAGPNGSGFAAGSQLMNPLFFVSSNP